MRSLKEAYLGKYFELSQNPCFVGRILERSPLKHLKILALGIFDYLSGGQVVAGSNPAVPTNFLM